MTNETEIGRVLAAVKSGCRTSREVAERTGMPAATASAHLSRLARCGLVHVAERHAVKTGNGRNHRNRCHLYAMGPAPESPKPAKRLYQRCESLKMTEAFEG